MSRATEKRVEERKKMAVEEEDLHAEVKEAIPDSAQSPSEEEEEEEESEDTESDSGSGTYIFAHIALHKMLFSVQKYRYFSYFSA